MQVLEGLRRLEKQEAEEVEEEARARAAAEAADDADAPQPQTTVQGRTRTNEVAAILPVRAVTVRATARRIRGEAGPSTRPREGAVRHTVHIRASSHYSWDNTYVELAAEMQRM